MSKTASDHAIDQSQTGAPRCVGSDGSSFSDRIERYGKACYISESIRYGESLGLNIVLDLLEDDEIFPRLRMVLNALVDDNFPYPLKITKTY